MKHNKSTWPLATASAGTLLGPFLACLLAACMFLAAPAAAVGSNYANLWRSLSPSEKEILLIGYARGLRAAENALRLAVCDEAGSAPARQHLLERTEALCDGLETKGDIKEVLDCLDAFYADGRNQSIDWTSLLKLARLKTEGATDEQMEVELARLRKMADDLEQLRKLHQAPPAQEGETNSTTP